MKVLLISANTETINMPTLPLGLACVAAATQKAGHEVAMVDLMAEKDGPSVLNGTIERFHPDLIGISVRNIDDQNMENPRFLLDPVKEIVACCRSLSDATIVLGGAGYSIFPESALVFLGADMVAQHFEKLGSDTASLDDSRLQLNRMGIIRKPQRADRPVS